LREKAEVKSRAQKLLEALTTKVREQFIEEIRVEEELKLKTELEQRDKLVAEEKAKRSAARKALMPMHRTLPDFVELNEQRFNYYDDPANEASLVEGLRFIKKIKPHYA